MAVLATDDFDRINAPTLGANWTIGIGAMQILTNQATWGSVAGDGSDAGETYTGGGVVWPDDQYGQVDISGQDTTGSETGIGILLRYADTGNYYRVVVSGDAADNVVIHKRVATVVSTITTRTQAWTNGDTLKVEIQGTTLRVYRNGVQMGADIAGDAALVSGAVGITYSSSANGVRADNFVGGDFTAGPVDTTTRRYQIRHSRMTSW